MDDSTLRAQITPRHQGHKVTEVMEQVGAKSLWYMHLRDNCRKSDGTCEDTLKPAGLSLATPLAIEIRKRLET